LYCDAVRRRCATRCPRPRVDRSPRSAPVCGGRAAAPSHCVSPGGEPPGTPRAVSCGASRRPGGPPGPQRAARSRFAASPLAAWLVTQPYPVASSFRGFAARRVVGDPASFHARSQPLPAVEVCRSAGSPSPATGMCHHPTCHIPTPQCLRLVGHRPHLLGPMAHRPHGGREVGSAQGTVCQRDPLGLALVGITEHGGDVSGWLGGGGAGRRR
jgi:hypothetical protein